MIDGLKPYPAMNDSGVPWLGEVPAHWGVRRLKYLLRERDIRSAEGTEQLLRVSQFTGVTERRRAEGGDEPDTRAESLVGYKCVEPNDLVVNIMLAWNGSMGVSSFTGIASPAYCVYRFGVVARPWYFHHLLRSPPYKARIKAVSTGVVESRLRLYTDDLYRLEALVPPLPEQSAIVRFLNHADRRIRRYIRAKQKLIKLLEEQKQAIVHRAVTRGLDPNVRLKPSGVEWLGDVPEHWEVIRVRNCLDDTRAGIWGDDPTPANEADHVTCLRVADFDMARLSIHGSKLTQRAVPESARIPRLLAAGDILMEKSGGGEAKPVGRVVLYDDNVAPYAVCSNFIVRLRPNRATTPQFLLHVLAIMQVTRRNVPCIKQTTGIQNLDERAYLSLAIGVPPIAEQRAIIVALGENLLPIEQGAMRARHEIDVLREFRTRLIADVVTGKLDVREAAARLPDEVEEPKPLDEIEAEGDTDELSADDADEVPEEAGRDHRHL